MFISTTNGIWFLRKNTIWILLSHFKQIKNALHDVITIERGIRCFATTKEAKESHAPRAIFVLLCLEEFQRITHGLLTLRRTTALTELLKTFGTAATTFHGRGKADESSLATDALSFSKTTATTSTAEATAAHRSAHETGHFRDINGIHRHIWK